MTLQATKVTAVRDGNAATAVTITSIAANTLLALFCHADSDDGSATESLSISSAGGLTWTKNVQSNGSPGAVVAIFTAPCAAGSSSITVSVADSQGSKDKSVFPVKFTDDNGGIPGTGNTSVAKPTTFSSSGAGSWAWGVGLGSDAGTPVETGQTAQDFVSGNSFNDGDNIVTFSLDAKSTASGQTMSLTFPSPLHDAALEITAGIPGGATSSLDTAQTATATQAAAFTAAHVETAAQTATATGTAAFTATRVEAASQTATATQATAFTAVHVLDAAQTVTATQTAALTRVALVDASQTATATQTATLTATHVADTSQTITATQTADLSVVAPGMSLDAAQTVSASQTAALTAQHNASANQAIVVTQAAALTHVVGVAASQTIAVTQTAVLSTTGPGGLKGGLLGVATTGARVQSATVGGIRSATSSGRLNSGSQ